MHETNQKLFPDVQKDNELRMERKQATIMANMENKEEKSKITLKAIKYVVEGTNTMTEHTFGIRDTFKPYHWKYSFH